MDRDRYFSDDAMIRRVLGEYAAALSGPRALLMMAAHPVAFEGFFMSTGALDDPYARLRRTAIVMDEITWGSRAKATPTPLGFARPTRPSAARSRTTPVRSPPARPTRPTIPSCCCGSSPA